jgi:4-amino-4-deoxy-L-arabinose transferase-like glycosyltransferase
MPFPISRDRKLTLLGILVLGATVRLWTAGAGLPYTVHVDEPAIMQHSVHIMKSGDFHPHFWDYPGLTIYLHSAVACVRFLDGAMNREWASLNQVWEGDFYLWARMVTALIGTLTIYVVFRLGLRWGPTAALLAAFAMAVQPQHVRESHFALTDTPLTFFVALTLLFSFRAAENNRMREFFLAGLAVGLSTAAKYNGALAILMPGIVACFVPEWRMRVFAALVVIAGALVGFLGAAPYSLIDLPGFLNGFASLMQHYNQPRPVSEVATTYFKYVLDWFRYQPIGMPRFLAWPALVLYFAGVVVLLSDLRVRATRAIALAALIFPPAYFWFVSSQSLQFGRYLMPIIPMLSLGVGVGIVATRDLIARRGFGQRPRTVLAALLLVLLPPLMTVITFNMDRRLTRTEELAGKWIQEHVRPDERIVYELAIQLPPKFQHEQVNRLIADLPRHRQEGAVYLVASSSEYQKYFDDPVNFGAQVAAYNDLFRTTETVQVFTPTADHPGATVRIMKIVR